MRPYPIALALLALLPASAPAQGVPPSLDSIGVGCCTIRIKGAEGSAEGKFQGKSAPGRIMLTPCKGNLCPQATGTQNVLAVPSGARIEMYRGRSAGKGAIVGAVLGAAAVSVSWLTNSDIDASAGEKIAIGIPVGALGGAVVGALVGTLFPRWVPVRP